MKPDPPPLFLFRRADVRNFPFNATRALLEAAGVAVPPTALPSARYLGPERLFVRTIRTTVAREEPIGTTSMLRVLKPFFLSISCPFHRGSW